MDDKRRVALVETQTDGDGNGIADPLQRYQLGNHLRSASVELDADGSLISYEEFHPYGTTAFQVSRGGAELNTKRYRYTGKERDEESGLYYHGARYYAPWLGRWVSCDPLALSDGVNLYCYSRNSPTRLVDPTGMQAEEPASQKQKAAEKEKELNQLEQTRKGLEKKYGITIEKGDKDWSAADLGDLAWALSRLSKKESAALKGYLFLRWQDRESRKAVDSSYDPSGDEEAGLHEADVKAGIFKISLYDQAFDKGQRVQLEADGKPVGEEQPASRLAILHEIGHAMGVADYRKAYEKYAPAEAAFNKLAERHNAASGKARQTLAEKYKRDEKSLDALGKRVDEATPKDNISRAASEFEALAKGMTPVTPYAATDANEGFAETFAVYKLNPQGIEARNPKLADWFKRENYLRE
jgi:RHS repeat-associated protein